MTTWKKIWIILIYMILLVPSASFFIKSNNKTKDTVYKSKPVLYDSNGIRWNFLKECGEFFSENFPLKDDLVTLHSLVWVNLFKSSPNKDVIVGKSGYLYYASTLDDYLGRNTMNDREIAMIKYNLELLQKTLNQQGIPFVFLIAPNKNSVYPQFMPDDYKIISKNNNARKLFDALKTSDINTFSAYTLFHNSKKVLYHKKDSHWNNEGAAMIAEKLLELLGKTHKDYLHAPFITKNDFNGDLYGMLFPSLQGNDRNIYYNGQKDFSYVYPVKNNFEMEIETTNYKKTDICMVFRDSFGNSLLPFLADEFAAGYFSRAFPFQAYRCIELKNQSKDNKCYCILEIVERHLPLLKKNAPCLSSLEEQMTEKEKNKMIPCPDINIEKQEHMNKIHGKIKIKDMNLSLSALDIFLSKKLYICIKKETHVKKYQAFISEEGDETDEDEIPFTVYLEEPLSSIPKDDFFLLCN